MIGVIPAAGFSTRVSELIGGRQKAACWVRFEKKSIPMVCRQIGFLRMCGVNEVYVVTGYKHEQVYEAVEKYGGAKPDGYILDREVKGLGNTWRIACRELGEPRSFLSLNVDDFIIDDDLPTFFRTFNSNDGVVFGTVRRKGMKDKSCYIVDSRDYRVKMCRERGGKTGYIGCGMYYIVGEVLDTVGNEPGEVVNELILLENKYVFKEVGIWIDMGNLEVLKYYLEA